VLRFFLLLLLFFAPSIPAMAVELLRDHHPDKDYLFEADQSDISPTVDTTQVIITATNWATHFYHDLLNIESCEFRDKPTRFWLITFARSNCNEDVYAVVLPNGSIVEPHTLMRD
jgi:hypothetical protein